MQNIDNLLCLYELNNNNNNRKIINTLNENEKNILKYIGNIDFFNNIIFNNVVFISNENKDKVTHRIKINNTINKLRSLQRIIFNFINNDEVNND